MIETQVRRDEQSREEKSMSYDPLNPAVTADPYPHYALLREESAVNRAAYGPERLAQIGRSSKAIRAYFEEVYDRRSAAPGNDLISGFIQAEVGGERLSRNEVLNLAILLLIGGVETTTNLLGIIFGHFKRQPSVLAAGGA